MKLTELADEAYENVRAINHLTIGGASLPAPLVYEVTGSLKAAEYGLRQALEQLAGGLLRSFDDHEVVEDDGADPWPRAHAAAGFLREAAERAGAIGDLLERAQLAINRQAYRRRVDVDEQQHADELEDLEG